jgi:hypothetical protein
VSAWKQFERDAAFLFKGSRFWANSGESQDFQGEVRSPDGPIPVHGQCKLVRVLSLEALTKLAEVSDVVCVKVRRGAGNPSPALVVMTFDNYRRLHG